MDVLTNTNLQVSINDVAVGRSVLESFRLLQAYKAEYEHGVFCAANWKPGEATLEPTQEATIDHISKNFCETKASGKEGIFPGLPKLDMSTMPKVRLSSAGAGPPSPIPPTPTSIAVGAINKVFHKGGSSSAPGEQPLSPMIQANEMNALNAANARNVSGHKKADSATSVQSYFDFEPYPTSPKLLLERNNSKTTST